MEWTNSISIPFSDRGFTHEMVIYSRSKKTKSCRIIDKNEAEEFGEACYQIKEGEFFEFTLPRDYEVREISDSVINSSVNTEDFNFGRIQPNTFTGTLAITLIDKGNKSTLIEKILIEVISVKINYRTDYRSMLASISDYSVELLMNVDSPVDQKFEIDEKTDSSSLYQKYIFLRSMIESGQLFNSIHKILESPVTNFLEIEENIPLSRLKKLNKKSVRELINIGFTPQRTSDHLNSQPSSSRYIRTTSHVDNIDTNENRFIKNVILEFQAIVYYTHKTLNNPVQKAEAKILLTEIEEILEHAFFNKVTDLKRVPMNSPLLQRKEGYREIFLIWLRLSLASKLIWKGGEDVYGGGKKNLAQLYEYYLYFFLLRIFEEEFHIEKSVLSGLFQINQEGININLKQGKDSKINFNLTVENRDFVVEFNYNRSFKGLGRENEETYPGAGSISLSLRPDFTLSFWPANITQSEAEESELITHIHFDAKYKLENVVIVDTDNEEDEINKFKNSDVLKMHSYMDAIRRTAGAYILYPGDTNKKYRTFKEILPSIGAFSVSPSNEDRAKNELKEFIKEVMSHLSNRISKREKLNYQIYFTQDPKNSQSVNEFREKAPELIGFFPDEVTVLLGFAKNQEHEEWIIKNKIYNVRIGDKNHGSIHLTRNVIEAKYLYLHSEKSDVSRLLKLSAEGPKIFSKEDLEKRAYPGTPSSDFYLVFTLESPTTLEKELCNLQADLSKIPEAKTGRQRSRPIAISLAQLLMAKK